MDLDQIKCALLSKFNNSKENENRKIVFWYDENAEFEYMLDDLDLENIKIWRLSENNNFITKYLLEKQDINSNYLVYAPFEKPKYEENWLLDIEMYSETFSANKIAVIMNELHIKNLNLKPIIEQSQKFFQNKERVTRFASYSIDYNNEKAFKIGIMAAICKLKTSNFEEVLKLILKNSLYEENNELYDKISKFSSINFFWEIVISEYGYLSEEKNLKHLFNLLIISSMAKDININIKNSLQQYISPKSSNCFVFIHHWLNNVQNNEILEEMLNRCEINLNIKELIEDQYIDDYKTSDTFSIFDKSIILNIIDELLHNVEDYDKYLSIIYLRKTKHWYKEYKYIYKVLENAIKFLKYKKAYSYDFPSLDEKEFLDKYAKEYFKFDYYYRKFIYFYDKTSNVDLLGTLREYIGNLYDNWYLEEINLKWSNSLKENNWFNYALDNQIDFYNNHVRNTITKNDRDKIIVIISDALRYETAVELNEKLNENTKGNSEVSYMKGIIPSVTKFGMAALLPHSCIEINPNKKVLLDGNTIDTLESRYKILKKYHESSTAINFETLMSLSREDGRELIKNNRIIYVYHNTIDAIGDKFITENKVFEACSTAINEIKLAIEKLINFNGNNIIVTSDHGFLYKRNKINPNFKIQISELDNKINKRYVLSDKPIEDIGLLNFNLNYLKNPCIASLPKNINLFKTSGSGNNYVHGGASLQEIVIPIIRFKNSKYSKEEILTKVNIALTSSTRKIINNTFNLTFIQVEKIEDKIIPREVSIFFKDEETGEIISNSNILVGDKTSDNIEERIFKVKFVLKDYNYDKNKDYYLIIQDNKDLIGKMPFKIHLGTNKFDLF